MNEENRLAKNKKIKENGLATRLKRKSQFCKVYTVKIDKSHLNQTTKSHLSRLFLEAKWFYNSILADVFNANDKLEEVPVKVQCAWNIRQLECLSSQMKQGIISRTKGNIHSLSIKKSKGQKVGALKYTSNVESIPLEQFERTYKILESKTKSRYITIQGIKQHLKVSGLSQIPIGSDFANANLIHKNNNFYLKITTYQDKISNDKTPKQIHLLKSIGIDFGIKNQLILSNGIEIQYKIEVTPKLKRLARKLSKQESHSKNWFKTKTKLNKEYQSLTNIKEDIKNKIVSNLKDNVEIICFQDENIKAWQRMWGKRILSTSIGGIIASLKQRVHTPVEVPKFFPSTKTCHACGNKQLITLSERIYSCSICNNIMDRDLNSSLNIESEGLRQIGMVHTELTPVEIRTSTLMLEYLKTIPNIKASPIHEPGSSSPFMSE